MANEKLIESLKMKDDRLKADINRYKNRRPGFQCSEKQAKEMWMDGWAACETVKGLQDLKYSKN